MTKENQEPDKQESSRDESGRWKAGFSGNLKGRPVGKTLKEFAREYLTKLTDEEKDAWLASLPKEIVWRMAEGNPKQETESDVTVTGPSFIRLDE